MKIIYYHQHFSTPRGAGGLRSYKFARRLVERRHLVTIICGSYSEGDTGLTGEYHHGVRRGMVDGIEVVEYHLPYSNQHNFARRTFTFLKYAAKSTWVALFADYDVLFATSTPLTATIPGIVAKVLRRKRFIFEVRDLWPDLPREMGVITNPLVLWSMGLLEWLAYNTADACIGLSPGIVEGIRRRTPSSMPIKMLPNACELELFGKGEPRRAPGVGADELLALYAGTHGIANGLDAVLDVAAELKRRQRRGIKIVLVGAGKLRESLMRRAAEERLDNVIFLPSVKKNEVAMLLRGANIGLQMLKNVPVFYYGTSPNKFFDYIAAGLPVLINYPGWLADLVEERHCGIAVPPDNPAAFADALERIAENRVQLKEMGAHARQLAETTFDFALIADEYVSFMEEIGKK